MIRMSRMIRIGAILLLCVAGVLCARAWNNVREQERLAKRARPREEVRVTVIPGTTIDDLARMLRDEFSVSVTSTQKLIGASADREPFSSSLRDVFAFLRPLPYTRSLEGYLVPETYRVWKDELPQALINKQLATFETRYASLVLRDIPRPLKTLDDVVILASIVEREVKTPADRARVACVFLNRLSIGMALQSDATIEYVTQSKRARSTAKDLAIDHEYNTYKRTGLPPGPIALPEAEAIDAVLHPSSCHDLYFLTDAKGTVLFAKTFAEHQANRKKAGF